LAGRCAKDIDLIEVNFFHLRSVSLCARGHHEQRKRNATSRLGRFTMPILVLAKMLQ
jgi:hypothetical protein